MMLLEKCHRETTMSLGSLQHAPIGSKSSFSSWIDREQINENNDGLINYLQT
jgi:hypothetical protein